MLWDFIISSRDTSAFTWEYKNFIGVVKQKLEPISKTI